MNPGKKKLDAQAVALALKELEELSEYGNALSVRELIEGNFILLSQSGKSIKSIHEFLKSKGLDVGSYEGFRRIYRRVRIRDETGKTVRTDSIAGATKMERRESGHSSAEPDAEKIKEPKSNKDVKADDTGRKKRINNPALPPIYLPGGVEAIIDPESGAKSFEI